MPTKIKDVVDYFSNKGTPSNAGMIVKLDAKHNCHSDGMEKISVTDNTPSYVGKPHDMCGVSISNGLFIVKSQSGSRSFPDFGSKLTNSLNAWTITTNRIKKK